MALSKIKSEYKSTVIAFGNSGLPLGKRDDIDQLAIIALESNDPSLIQLFDRIPPLEQLKKTKVEAELKAAAAVPEKPTDKIEEK